MTTFAEAFDSNGNAVIDSTAFDPSDSALDEFEQANLMPWTVPDAIDQVARIRAQQEYLHAQEQRELARLARVVRSEPSLISGSDRELAHRSLVAELAVVARVSDRTMASRLADAEQLVNDFPATVAALEAGKIGRGHARTIVDAGTPIMNPENRARYEEAVLERACSGTPGQLRTFAQVTAARLGDVTLQDRYERAASERKVVATTLPDGMAQLTHTLPALLASGIWNRLTAQAKALAASGDPRTFDQLRSDLATELLLVSEPGSGEGSDTGAGEGESDAPHGAGIGIRAEVSIVIPALTLLGVSDEPATIAGSGPIDLETAKRMAADADHWVRVITHPVSGAVVAADTYRPGEQLKRLVWARDGRCQFPTCNQPPRRCDLDHTLDWQFGGKTRPSNLACLCRGHHTLKHHGGWKVRHTSPGVLEWTSPQGRKVPAPSVPGPSFASA